MYVVTMAFASSGVRATPTRFTFELHGVSPISETPVTCGNRASSDRSKLLSMPLNAGAFWVTSTGSCGAAEARALELAVLLLHHEHDDQEEARGQELHADEQRPCEARSDSRSADSQRLDRRHARQHERGIGPAEQRDAEHERREQRPEAYVVAQR